MNKHTVTIYKDVFSKEPRYISVDSALKRIQEGRSKEQIEKIRSEVDKERADKLKCRLPSVCFSGVFKIRKDEELIEHSGFIVLDFDNVEDPESYKAELSDLDYMYAAWISPSGNGVKGLVKIANGDKHREHFQALQEEFNNLDTSGINESRVCYESYDSDIYINDKAKPFKKVKKTERVEVQESLSDKYQIFENIKKWLANQGSAFVKGERNIFMFKLASACCRFGLTDDECINLASASFTDSTFSFQEMVRTVNSAYRANSDSFNTAEFTRDKLVDKTTRNEIETKDIDPDIYKIDVKPKDVVFGEDVKGAAIDILTKGYAKVDGIGVAELDYHFKMKRGEATALTGYGNYGKSTFEKWMLLMRILKFGDKFAFFSPEDNPAEEFYHDFVEIYLGKQCTPDNPNRPSEEEYKEAYDFISDHVFYIYPETVSPTPEYIKERFLELIIKENVDGCIIDPFNQLTNDYSSSGGRSDKYLEVLLSDFSRFAQSNNIFFTIIAHPKSPLRIKEGENYPCPDVYDIADGAMWNNKMDNILVYHRPFAQADPQNSSCEFHSKKIRRQKVVGKKGYVSFTMNFAKRRYFFGGRDYMEELITGKQYVPEVVIPEGYNVNQTFESVRNEDDWIQDEIVFDNPGL